MQTICSSIIFITDEVSQNTALNRVLGRSNKDLTSLLEKAWDGDIAGNRDECPRIDQIKGSSDRYESTMGSQSVSPRESYDSDEDSVWDFVNPAFQIIKPVSRIDQSLCLSSRLILNAFN